MRLNFAAISGTVFCFSGITLIIFGLTLLPFTIWNTSAFLEEGPFTIQIVYLPIEITLIFILIAIITGWYTSNIKDAFFYTDLLLFAIAATSFMLIAVYLGMNRAIFEDRFDITYFIFCIPFFTSINRKPAKQ